MSEKPPSPIVISPEETPMDAETIPPKEPDTNSSGAPVVSSEVPKAASSTPPGSRRKSKRVKKVSTALALQVEASDFIEVEEDDGEDPVVHVPLVGYELK